MTTPETAGCASTLVIFGGTGDLARRKLVPALAHLRAAGALPADLRIVLTGRQAQTPDASLGELRELHATRLAADSRLARGLDELRPSLYTLRLDPGAPDAPDRLREGIEAIEQPGTSHSRLFYLAVPPDHIAPFLPLLEPLLAGTTPCSRRSRIIVEKPFGHDLASASALEARLGAVAREEQILRIDHYLGKEAVQNILVMRFANAFFEPVWNRHYIDHVQISFAEQLGVGHRAAFFESTGILRDVIQNHLLQVLCLTAMEPPLSHRAESIRFEKLKVLKALRPIAPDATPTTTVRGRYAAGRIAGKPVPGYLDEPGVPAGSTTETYAALQLHIDTWRWSGVPFYLRAGKRLSASQTEISVHFRPVPGHIFPASAGQAQPNVLVMRVQPNEGSHLRVNVKTPGRQLELGSVGMDFSYQTSFGPDRPDAYERLLIDAIQGDTSLFISQGEIDASWRFIDPIIQGWQRPSSAPPAAYTAGSDGPAEADRLLEAGNRAWRPLCTEASCPW
ncbi:MAG TPA: glucose-6-phosphate dehydrogenase [Candidatus Ozemobacteraceae bacterium]|nr:glucose-6-phosphate dehydrogenase [Candidatus Ozemobacteraceae bacterium]